MEYTPADDTFGRKVSLDYHTSFPFQGLQTEVRCNSPEVIKWVNGYFGIWNSLADEHINTETKLTVNIILHRDDHTNSKNIPFVYRAYGDYFLGANGSNLYMVDIDKGLGLCFITPELASEREKFSYEILLSILRVLVTGFDRGPIHAGAVVFNNRPLLFIGKSGIGKSTLCYACVRQGFGLLTDEVAFVSIKNGLRIWSGSHYIRLCPESVKYFPELANISPRIQVSGKLKFVIDAKILGTEKIYLGADKPIVFVLQRHNQDNSLLKPISSEVLINALYESIEPGFDLNRQLDEVIQALANVGKYGLIVGNDPNEVIASLKNLIYSG